MMPVALMTRRSDGRVASARAPGRVARDRTRARVDGLAGEQAHASVLDRVANGVEHERPRDVDERLGEFGRRKNVVDLGKRAKHRVGIHDADDTRGRRQRRDPSAIRRDRGRFQGIWGVSGVTFPISWKTLVRIPLRPVRSTHSATPQAHSCRSAYAMTGVRPPLMHVIPAPRYVGAQSAPIAIAFPREHTFYALSQGAAWGYVVRYLRWHERLETGHSDVDQQHRAMHTLVNDLNACALLGNDREQSLAALERIARHTIVHFQDEEALMIHSAYPRLREHIAIHRAFSQTVADLLEEHRAGRGPSVAELAKLMEDWLETHIRGEDRLLIEHVRS